MKKFTLTACLLAASLAAMADGQITLTTSAPVGTVVKFLPNVVSATQPITVDFGNGVEQKFTVDPSSMAYNRWIEGTIEGSTIIIKGNLTELDFGESHLTTAKIENMFNLKKLELDNNELTSFELATPAPLTSLNLSHNQLSNSPTNNPTLGLENCEGPLTDLNVSHNTGLQCLDIRDLTSLVYLTANDCPEFASIFICMPEDAHTSLRNINLANCNLSNFYPITMPELRSLDLSNNNLMTKATDNTFVLGNYPALTSLSVNGNKNVDVLDVTKCPNLDKLYINDCDFSSIDISQCPELLTFNAANNNLRSVDLGNNKKLSYINVAGNPISKLDITQFPSISSINISDTEITCVDLMKAFYLKDFKAANSKIAFVDFNGQQPNRMKTIDLRNCPNFTYESMAYTLKTLPPSAKTYSTNLFVEGSNADHADTDYVTSSDMGWMIDVEGDGTATYDNVAVTLQGATDTGENKTGVVDRLYPYMGYSMPYDLDVMETEGGRFIICQWQPEWFQTMESVNTEALKGVPIAIYPYPEEGKRFKSVTVNGKDIYDPWFIVTEPSTIKVNFSGEDPSISFDVEPGHDFTMLVMTGEENGTVYVDWGTGTRTEYPNQRKYEPGSVDASGVRIDGTAAGNRITVYGDIAAIDVSGFGDVAEYFGLWDNHILGVDPSNAPDLRLLNVHWNPITSLDLSQNTRLNVLDIGYCNLKSIDLSHNNDLMWLDAYSDGYGDPEDGISMLESIDVSNMPYLQYLDVKNNRISSVDLSNNPYLTWCFLQNNGMNSVDVSNNPELKEFSAAGNNLTTIDVTSNTKLTELWLDDNQLTSVDVSKNVLLEDLSIADNYLTALDTHNLSKLQRLWINGNGMTAEQLNDLYYLLPDYVDDGSNAEMGMGYNLYVIQGNDREENDGRRADSSIATFHNWIPSHTGSNGGCETAYLDLLPTSHGTFTVTDGEGNVYGNGSKVPKYIPLTINVTAEEGYAFSSFTLNGEEPQKGTTFEMPGIFTRLKVNILKDVGVNGVYADGSSIVAGNGYVRVTSEAGVATVFNAAGIVMAEAAVDGETEIALPAGYYVVRLQTADNAHTNSVIVK